MTERAKSTANRTIEVMIVAIVLLHCDRNPVVHERTQVIEDKEWPQPRVEGSRLIFPGNVASEIEMLRPGDVLMSSQGDGLLRLVREIHREGDEIIIETEQAALTDAIVDGDLRSSHRLESSAQALRPSELPLGESLEGISLVAAGGVTARISRGSARFDPTIDVDVRIRDSRVQRFSAAAGGQLELELAVEIEATAGVSIPVELSLLPPLRFRFVHFVGIAPVVEVVSLTLIGTFQLEVEAGVAVEIGFRAHGMTSAEIVYDGNWSAGGEHSVDLDRIGPTRRSSHAGFNVRAQVTPRIDIKFYGIAGPYIEADAFAEYQRHLSTRPVSWELDAGIVGRIGASFETEFNILGRDVGFSADVEREIFRSIRELASGISCSPFERRCSEGSEYVCSAEGDEETSSPCSTGACRDEGACDARVCSPGESRCTNGTLYTCDDLGRAEMATSCASGVCRDGASCQGQSCTPNTSRCANGILFACDSAGLAETSSPCPSGQCEDSARCLGQICTPNTARCAGGQLFLCGADGTSEASQPCASGACADTVECSSCGGFNEACCVNGPECAGNVSCSGGICASCASPCSPGAVRCAGGNVEECGADGCSWITRDTCIAMFPGGADCCDDLRTRPEPECIPTTAPMNGGLLLEPIGGAYEPAGNIMFMWNPMSWVDRFELRFCSTADQSTCDQPIVVPLGQTSHVVDLGVGTYYWTVRAIRACDLSAWSPWVPQASMLTVF